MDDGGQALMEWNLVQMNPSQTIFAVFFAIFWGTAANAWPKWKPFHWTFVIGNRRVAARVAWSVLALNVAPVVAFGYAMQELGVAGSSVDWRTTIRGVIPAFAIFGIYRMWIAVVELLPDVFYYSDRDQASEKPHLIGIDPTQEILKIEDGCRRWWANLLFGRTIHFGCLVCPRFHGT